MVGRLATMSTMMQESIAIGEPIITCLQQAKHHQAPRPRPRPRRDTAWHERTCSWQPKKHPRTTTRHADLQTGSLNLLVYLQPGEFPVIIVARPNGDTIAVPQHGVWCGVCLSDTSDATLRRGFSKVALQITDSVHVCAGGCRMRKRVELTRRESCRY